MIPAELLKIRPYNQEAVQTYCLLLNHFRYRENLKDSLVLENLTNVPG